MMDDKEFNLQETEKSQKNFKIQQIFESNHTIQISDRSNSKSENQSKIVPQK